MKIKTLKFINEDACLRELTMDIEEDAIEVVIELYSAFYEGDDWHAFVDGVEYE